MSDGQVIPVHVRDQRLADEIAAAIRIVQGIQDGSRDAETELVQRYSRGLRYLILRKTGDDELADDLLQETLIIAIRKLREQTLENPQRLAGYLRGIAIRVVMNARRRQSREAYPADAGVLESIPDQGKRQFEQVSTQETNAAVHELLDSMTVKRDRELLLRYYVYEEEKPEICRALGLDSLHFNRVLYRAKNRFRKILEHSAEGSDLAPD
jgi:RNA polymerase sigma-70 factor (ECF subfamily)